MWSSSIDFSLFSMWRSEQSFQNINLVTILSTMQNLQWLSVALRIKTSLKAPYKNSLFSLSSQQALLPSFPGPQSHRPFLLQTHHIPAYLRGSVPTVLS